MYSKLLLIILILIFPVILYSVMTVQQFAQQAIPVWGTTCDQRYAIEMELVKNKLAHEIGIRRLQQAEDYMIMIKQHQDLGFRLSEMERKYFDIATIANLRMPLQQYSRCRDSFISGTLPY